MMKLKNKIYHGVAYYTELWDKENIHKYIENMKKEGINVVIIAEFSWALLEPKEDEFNIELFDYVINELGENGIETIFCTPTATPPRWFTKKYPDSLYVDKNMVKANHGSREHVCFNDENYIKRSKIIVEKLAMHYGKNKYIIAWQTHNEYNCPPVNECVCDNCQSKYRSWLKNKYQNIDNLNQKWGSGVWSTKYNSFDDIIAPRPTPNGHSASMSTNYTLFTFDSVAKYNKMQVDILKKYINVPITHNTNKCFHLNQESLFEPLDFVSFDCYLTQDMYQELVFDAEMCRCLKKDTRFFEMETACMSSSHLHGGYPVHKKGFVKIEAVNQFFAGSTGFSYWLFRQQRSGTEMPHAHLVNAFGTLSAGTINVLEVKKEIEKLEDFLLNTKNNQAHIALLYSDYARAFVATETLGCNNYFKDILDTYKVLLRLSVYRDIIYETSSFSNYDVIIIPFMMNMKKELIEKVVQAAKDGATIIVGPYSGWRDESHTYYIDKCYGNMEDYFASHIIDCDKLLGQDATYKSYGIEEKIECQASIIENGIGTINGGYFDKKSLISENKIGKGKIVFIGTKFNEKMQEKYLSNYIDEKIAKEVIIDEGIIIYKRHNKDKQYICLVNMTREDKNFKLNVKGRNYFSKEGITVGKILANDYVIIEKYE
ncbi:MAG: beta-galactosidase [Candidatus Caccosoma sp.]|nr:beta-galactosidase [Candidatus Caccosoma sp.]